MDKETRLERPKYNLFKALMESTHWQKSGKVLNTLMREYFLIQNRPKVRNSLTKTHELKLFYVIAHSLLYEGYA